MFDEPDESGESISLHAVCDLPEDKEIAFKVTNLTAGKEVLCKKATAKADESVIIGEMKIEKGEKHFFFIEWTMDGKKYSNHYMTNIRDIDYTEYLSYIAKCGYDEFSGF